MKKKNNTQEVMKRIISSIASIAALVGFVSCQKTELVPSQNTEGSTFTLSADIQQTKTTINGLEVNWEEGDILYLVTTDGTWGKPYTEDKECATIAEYTYADGEFTSEATIVDGNYTFNALYGSASEKSYHRGASTTYNLQSTQTQDCTNPTAHLKNNDALVGSFTASVPRTTPASVNMSHIFAIMRVDVKNATGADVELKSFEMSAAGATLAGIFTVNFAHSPIDITEKSGQSSSIKVNLTNGTVASGASLPVYFVMAPLADYSGDVTFTVTDVNGVEYTKTVALTNISFEAGSLNTTPYTIKTGVAPEKTIYSTEFNYSTVTDNGQTYYNKGDEYIGTDTDAKTSWGITYGNWNGSNCAQLRVYSAGNFGSVYTKFDVSYATKVSYKAKVNNTALTLNTYYSTDSGKNWVKVDDAKALSETLTEYSFTISETGEYAKNRIKFEVSGTKPSSGNYQLTIDDVSIYGNGEVLETVITKLEAPKNLMADISTSSVNSIDVDWDAVDNAGSYVVTAKSAGGTVVSKEITTNSYTFVGLDYETAYTISVYAKSSNTELFTDSDVVTYAETITTGAKQEGTETGYTLVSSSLTEGTYLIAALSSSTYYFVNGNSVSSGIGVEETGISSSENNTIGSLPVGAVEIELIADSTNEGYFFFVIKGDTDTYLYATDAKASLTWSTDKQSESFKPSVSTKDANGFTLQGLSGSKVSQNGSSKASYIRNYASSGAYYNAIYFFKKN